VIVLVLQAKEPKQPIYFPEFGQLTQGLIFLKRVYIWDLTIPHFDKFRNKIGLCYEEIKNDENNEYGWGEVA
jgi:hypothetical protein